MGSEMCIRDRYTAHDARVDTPLEITGDDQKVMITRDEERRQRASFALGLALAVRTAITSSGE